MGVEFTISVDATKGIQKLNEIGKQLKPNKVLTLMGMDMLSWIDKNFKAEGLEGKWKPLSPNTIAARRKKGKGAKILQDTGHLKSSFVLGKDDNIFTVSGTTVTVGSADKKAHWHQKGTKSYDIYPKTKEYLSFIYNGKRVFRKKVHHPGLAERPMLPSKHMASEIAKKSLEAYVSKIVASVRGK